MAARIQTRLLPQPPLNVTPEVKEWMRSVVKQMTDFINEVASLYNEGKHDYLRLTPLEQEPASPFVGMVARADGVNWDPGSGEGVYEYTSAGNWSKF